MDAETIARIDTMTAEELRALIRRCAWPQWAVGLLTKEEVAEAMLQRLAEKALDRNGRETLAAINQWLDRVQGKAITPIAAQIQVKEEVTVSLSELARQMAFVMEMGRQDTQKTIEAQPDDGELG